MSGKSDRPAALPGADPSMEDILASIRRILSEDDVAPASAAPPLSADDDVLALDSSMIVPETPAMTAPSLFPEPSSESMPSSYAPISSEPPHEDLAAPRPSYAGDLSVDEHGLVAPEVAAAAANSVGSLVRTLHERAPVYRGGPTLDDMVREELRPVLKQWLDANLPGMVERLVRAEIERVVNRAL